MIVSNRFHRVTSGCLNKVGNRRRCLRCTCTCLMTIVCNACVFLLLLLRMRMRRLRRAAALWTDWRSGCESGGGRGGPLAQHNVRERVDLRRPRGLEARSQSSAPVGSVQLVQRLCRLRRALARELWELPPCRVLRARQRRAHTLEVRVRLHVLLAMLLRLRPAHQNLQLVWHQLQRLVAALHGFAQVTCNFTFKSPTY